MKNATLAVLTAAALLAACGGNGHSHPSATEEVPPRASESVDGFIEYLKKLVASDADMLEPVDTASVTGPTDETTEPKQVD